MVATKPGQKPPRAARRRDFHQDQVATATSIKGRLWRAAGWLSAEGKRRPPEEFEVAVRQVVSLAEELSERNLADDRQ